MADVPGSGATQQPGLGIDGEDIGPLVEALAERNLFVQNRFAAIYGPAGRNYLMQVVSDALLSQHSDGSWGSDDSPRLKPALTAQTIILLWRLGIRYNLHDQDSDGLGPGRSILRALRWLERVQRADGSWGEDAWDTCHVLEALNYCGYTVNDVPVDRGLRLIRKFVDDNWPDKTSYWYGAGFCGAALIVFNAYGDSSYANRSLEQLWEYWSEEDQHFLQPHDDSESQRAPAEWHTACAILGLKSFGSVSPRPEKVDKAFGWLRSVQTLSGCWSAGHVDITCYTTKQVIAALAASGYERNRSAALSGTEWFLTQCRDSEGALIVLLMAAFAIARTRAEELVTEVSFYFVTEVADLLLQYRTLTNTLTEQRRELKEKAEDLETLLRERNEQHRIELQGYPVRITYRQLAIWGALLTLITFAIGVVLTLGITFMGR